MVLRTWCNSSYYLSLSHLKNKYFYKYAIINAIIGSLHTSQQASTIVTSSACFIYDNTHPQLFWSTLQKTYNIILLKDIILS